MSVSARERCCFVGDPFEGVGVERPAPRLVSRQQVQTAESSAQATGQTQSTRAEVTTPAEDEVVAPNQYGSIGRGGYFVSKSGI